MVLELIIFLPHQLYIYLKHACTKLKHYLHFDLGYFAELEQISIQQFQVNKQSVTAVSEVT